MKQARSPRPNGFTLIELLVAMAIIAILLTLVTPRYYGSVDRARETVLRDDLSTLRRVIDQFHGDRARYPNSLDELVEMRYLREVPLDPLTERRDSWRVVAPGADAKGNVADVKSGAPGKAADGSNYADW
ncbi:prepilin-type N-terminal cleavage/methylation domain-containing protein [Chitinimonas arctica]|uniref:Prepilin-type N-terminal cleavage/methylation domain-containing protein n=1 Tax=Chitinimonas arctica TaxID=2594795 RepID=A0A516SBA0_9NEIS|nr:prepilin-type N-terminal cleavage/methylation domain-containing protein [Chitinimonas arctica]QDQ25420.1 prepilin-type N-terminal cleavage/methylation domain-containing protein [Chitinimonas arctica]